MSRWLPVPPPESWYHDPEQLRDLLRERNLTGAQAGALIGVDGRTVRKWTAPADQSNARAMPYSAYYCLVHRSRSSGRRPDRPTHVPRQARP